ncbi:MAG: ATP-binding protein [Polyangiales bacterium]
MGEEVARLIGVQQSVLAAQARFQRQREALAASRDAILGWRRRARAARTGSGDDPDAMYDALRQALRGARDDLERALDDLDSTTSALPSLGPDPLSLLAVDVPTAAARERRRAVSARISEARREETALRASRASTRFEACEALNLERLALMPALSSAKRDAVTGFSAAGLDQARAEARQLSLILRYHRRIGVRWLDALIRQRRVEGASTWELVRVGLSLLLALLAFGWLSRHSASLLAFADERLSEADRVDRRVAPSPLRLALRALRGVHRPLGRLALFQIVVWILPSGLRGLLEAQLVMTIVGWLLAGSLVVNAINAAAARRAHGDRGDDALRLRSLQLVGRVVVGFALVLVLSARLVGKGTVYDWTLVLCWFAAAPLVLILTTWWRESIFARVERAKRKRSPTQAWVLSKREGWQSFFAAMVGAAHLIAAGAARVARAWLGDFDLVRRGHAYLFKRELERLGDGGPREEHSPLNPEALAALSPDRPSATWIACPANALRDALKARAARREGGVVAVVGRQGMGKSTMFRHLVEDLPDALMLCCDAATGASRIAEALAQATAASTPPRAPAVVILDDAHAMVRPVFGGLEAFDETLALARGRSDETLWVFAVDAIVWPFLRRARDTRPMFDEVTELAPWTDAQIGELLSARSAEAGLSPIFDDLLERLPASADELDRQEALASRRDGYFRMIWDYARGNPAIALESWRASLVEGRDGGARARALQTPNVDSLETLPDEALFVLRAVLQMSPASPRDVADATRVPVEQVENVFRFGRAAGYLAQRDARVFVPWRWRRPVIVLLERRHLLVNP